MTIHSQNQVTEFISSMWAGMELQGGDLDHSHGLQNAGG